MSHSLNIPDYTVSIADEDLNQSFRATDEINNINNTLNETLLGAETLQNESVILEGTLDEETISKNLSNLGRVADGSKMAYLNLTLPGFNLTNVSSLAKFKELQVLELSYNNLSDLSVLSELPFLLSLNVSHNKIEKLFDFLPPYNLKEASFSFNQIREIGNLSNFHYLQSLELNNNKIEKIEGLEYCQRLKNLNLAHNGIKKIEGLENLPLVNLDLRSNQIKKIEGLDSLKFLRTLILADNFLRSLKGIPPNLEFLEILDMENNKINNLNEIEHLVKLNLLRDLNLHRNPICEIEDYYMSVIFKISKLTILDRKKIDQYDKVNSNNIFNPSPEYIASRDHMTNFIFNIIQDHKVKESTLPSIDSPYPILILCGPEGAGANEIARKLSNEYPGYFDYVVTHTTRRPKNEREKLDYNCIKMQDFEQDVTQGKFICCNEYFGDWFGVQMDSVEAVARQGLACIIQMELESLLSFKQTYFEPRCVLILTLDKMVQAQRLVNQNCSDNECEIAINRSEWYAEYNRDHPGFFDAVIITDDINDGYANLRNLVLNYLGVANQEQQRSVHEYQTAQNLNIQRQLSTLQSTSRPKTDEMNALNKDYDVPRSDSFLPSNTLTGNRSQMSHLSIESLSHMYNQNLRLKFGSAPAQLLSIGEQAEKSMEKRVSALKNHFNMDNVVNTKSQLSHHMSKQAMQGTISSISWAKWGEEKSKSLDQMNSNKSGRIYESPMKKAGVNLIRYNEDSDNSSDDDDDDEAIIVTNKKNTSTKIKQSHDSISSRETGRLSNSSSNMEIEKFY